MSGVLPLSGSGRYSWWQSEPSPPIRHIEWRIDALPTIDCDPGLTKQVFVNLLSNAAKYTPTRTGGRRGRVGAEGRSAGDICA
jgi:signal transduction histidine kinase